MSDANDRLDEAARALREATDAPAPAAELTRARILAAHRSRSAARPMWLAAAAFVLVFLGAPSAWALSTGRARVWIAAAIEMVTGHEAAEEPVEDAPAPRPRRERTTSPQPVSLPEPVSVPEPEPVPDPEPVVPPVPVVPVDPTVAEAEPRPSRVAPTEIHDPAEREERLAYRRAHALQFEQGEHAAAIEAWTSYLAAHPDGRFAVEAAYNRALCLARTGRASEAIRALGPFAAGEHGGYRQREATELIEALEAPDGGVTGVEE